MNLCLKLKGSATVFLSFMFIFTVAVVGSLSDSARFSECRAMIMDDGLLAAENVMAEYQREIFDDYHVFFVDAGSLGGDVYGSGLADKYLKTMTGKDTAFGHDWMRMKAEFSSFSFKETMTENNCAFFTRQAAEYMKTAAPAGMIAGLAESLSPERVEAPALPDEEELALDDGEESEMDSQERQDAIDELARIKDEADTSKGIVLSALLPDGATISGKSITEYPAWKVTGEGSAASEFITDKPLLIAYAGSHFSDYVKKIDDKEHKLSYEREYLVVGKDSDKENIKSISERLFAVRLATWTTYYETDRETQEEANIAATTISAALGMPFLEPAIVQAVVVGKALAAARSDVKKLFAGEKVEMLPGMEKKIGYEDYLSSFLLLTGKDELATRMVRLIEQNVRCRYSKNFNASFCYCGVSGELHGQVKPAFLNLRFIRMLSKNRAREWDISTFIEYDLL